MPHQTQMHCIHNHHRGPPTAIKRTASGVAITVVLSHPKNVTGGLRCNLLHDPTRGLRVTGRSDHCDLKPVGSDDCNSWKEQSYPMKPPLNFSYPHSLRGTLLLTGRSLLLNLIRIRAPLFQPRGNT